MPRHVEHDDAIVLGDARVVEQAAILPPVGARGVQAKERNAFARFLDIEAMRAAEQVEVQIAADGWLETRAHAASLRGLPAAAITPLK